MAILQRYSIDHGSIDECRFLHLFRSMWNQCGINKGFLYSYHLLILLRFWKRDNAKGNMENGTDLWRIVRYERGNDVVRIYNDSPPRPVFSANLRYLASYPG
ncbi:uncharacterized protein LOC116414058 [Apis florea]|uniref:uncharacterized protein LOC116414058 n=1 Tax=Apis florea TaxID=7463 RepID=UPI0012FF0D5E|nr:uncharacterized protein LOC116414058 [Apis florea]